MIKIKEEINLVEKDDWELNLRPFTEEEQEEYNKAIEEEAKTPFTEAEVFKLYEDDEEWLGGEYPGVEE